MTAKQPVDQVAHTVVRFLGFASIIGLLVVGGLCYVALQYEGDGSTIAVIAIVGNLASAALASLGSILASTGKGAPQPVTVENKASDPVVTTDVPASAYVPTGGLALGENATSSRTVAPPSEFGAIDTGTAIVLAVLVLLVLVVVGVL